MASRRLTQMVKGFDRQHSRREKSLGKRAIGMRKRIRELKSEKKERS